MQEDSLPKQMHEKLTIYRKPEISQCIKYNSIEEKKKTVDSIRTNCFMCNAKQGRKKSSFQFAIKGEKQILRMSISAPLNV